MRFTRQVALILTSLLLSVSALAATPKVIKKVPPDFPREASSKGITQGVVKAKLNIEPDGKVSSVEILEADPKRVFDRAVTSALMEWKFEPAGEKMTHEVKLVFKNED
jgi:protein TonB